MSRPPCPVCVAEVTDTRWDDVEVFTLHLVPCGHSLQRGLDIWAYLMRRQLAPIDRQALVDEMRTG